ncbi:oligosaccharide flippase family protein [Bizionia gelidisalsuginis]|nr:oligosaccharide flippase family protein [Bizionia gelidisalsuginis]
MKALYNRLKQNPFVNDSFWALFGNVAAKGMSLLGAIVVARFLGKDIYGEYGAIRSTLMNIAVFSTFGLGYTATKFIAENREKKPFLIKRIASLTMKISAIVSALMATLLFFFAGYVANIVLEAPHLDVPLRLVAFWIVFNSLTTAQIGILAGFNAYKAMAKINTVVGITAFTTSVALTYYYGLNGALSALLLTQIVNWYLNYREVLKNIPIDKPGTKTENDNLIKTIINFSTPVALQEGLYALTSWLMIMLLIKLDDYGEVGLYSAALQWSAIILFIPGIMRNVILSHLSNSLGRPEEHAKLLKTTLLINFGATIVPFVVIYILKDWVVSFYGISYQEELGNILAIAIFTSIFVSLSNVYAQAFMSLNKNWYMFGLRFVRDFFVLIATYLLITKHIFNGALALVISNLLTQICFLFILMIVYKKIKNALYN